MRPYFQLIRGGNVLVSFGGTVIAGLAARGGGLPTQPMLVGTLLLAGLSTSLVTAGGNVLNDVGDRDSDRTNHPNRPLVTGAVSVLAAKRLMLALLVGSGLAIAPIVLAAPFLAVIWVSALAALFAYELRLKANGLSGNAAVAFLTGAVFLYGGAAVGRIAIVIPFALMAFAATLSREVIKDMEDAGGDISRRTLPRTRGLPVAGLAARVSVALAIGLSPVPLVTFLPLVSLAGIVYAGIVLVADGLFVASVFALPLNLRQEQQLSKGAMTVALAAFLSAAFR